MIKRIELAFEAVLWHSRLLALVAVVASLLVAIGIFFLATVDVLHLLAEIGAYATTSASHEVRETLRQGIIGETIKVLDVYLLAVIMLIFSLGLYELFINKIDLAEGSDVAERLLLIRSLDDLKNRLANVVLLMLVVKFFQQALRLKYSTTLDLLAFAGGMALVGLALFLSHHKAGHTADHGRLPAGEDVHHG
ncbi:MAG: YqhA family protein [Fimbriimonadaceae bacterium]|nr:YqhA family protein [Fimbriimonadaceae bacterium]